MAKRAASTHEKTPPLRPNRRSAARVGLLELAKQLCNHMPLQATGHHARILGLRTPPRCSTIPRAANAASKGSHLKLTVVQKAGQVKDTE